MTLSHPGSAWVLLFFRGGRPQSVPFEVMPPRCSERCNPPSEQLMPGSASNCAWCRSGTFGEQESSPIWCGCLYFRTKRPRLP
jgi:hypothetical protein